MLRFNTLLRAEAIDPADVKLVRHQDNRFPGRPTPYDLWRKDVASFETYQRIQRRAVFSDARFLASFVGTTDNDTLFVGLYELHGLGRVPAGTLDPLSGEDVGGLHYYDLTLSPLLADLSGKLFIAWGAGYRSWVQLAHKRDKSVLELRRTVSDPPFPGFRDFCARLDALIHLPPAWRETLSSVSGVYLLTCLKTRRLYVGSAHGGRGFWGRWMDYVASGHGGNLRLREVPDSEYQVTVLEIASSAATPAEIVDLENRWKQKLFTRDWGLNAN